MRHPLIVAALLIALTTPAVHPLETTPELLRDQQRDSLRGLESLNLQSLVLTPEPAPESMLAILQQALTQAGLQVDSSTRSLLAKPPYLRLAYDIKAEPLDGKQVFLYWVSLDLLQKVTWTWITDPPGEDGGLATTWASFHTGVAASPEEAALEIEQHVRDLSQELTADIQALQSPHWVGDAIGMYPDGSMRCVEYDSKVTRRARPPG